MSFLVLIFANQDIEAFWMAALGGILLDLASPLRFGIFTLIIILFVLATKYFIEKMLSELNIWMILGIIFIESIIFDAILVLITNHQLTPLILITGFYGVLLFFIFYRIVLAILKPAQKLVF